MTNQFGNTESILAFQVAQKISYPFDLALLSTLSYTCKQLTQILHIQNFKTQVLKALF